MISIPPRTKCTIKMSGTCTVPSDAENIEIPMQVADVIEYECVDCEYKTTSVEVMEEHHKVCRGSRRQRFVRWLDRTILWILPDRFRP